MKKLNFSVGDEVEFAGYSTPSFNSPPKLGVGDRGEVVSAKQPGQIGFDYGVRMQSGGTFDFDQCELRAAAVKLAQN